MGFLDTVVVPGKKPTPAAKKSAFLSSIAFPSKDYVAPPPTPAPKPGLFASAVDAVKNYAVSGFQQAIEFEKQLLSNPIKTFKSIPDTFADGIIHQAKEGFSKGVQAVDDIRDDYKKGTGSTAGDIGHILQLGNGVVQTLFSPISGTFEAAQHMPVLKQVADAVSIPFTVTGAVGAYASGRTLDRLAENKVISPETRDILKAPLQEAGSTAAMVLLGGKLTHGAIEFAKTKKPFTPAEAHKIVFEAKRTASEVPQSAPTEPSPIFKRTDTAPEAPIEAPKIFEKSTTPPAPELQPSKIGKSIEQKAVENGLTKGFSETAGYDPITIKDQSARATKLINETPDLARSIIRGEEPLPEGLRGTALITAFEEHIKTSKDPQAAYELANSHLVSKTSFAAQELRLAAERVPDSMTAKLQELRAARETAVEKRVGKPIAEAKRITAEQIKKQVKVKSPTKQDWQSFLEEVRCNY